jgi:predicted TIM-barrel fold metal-dependent hydrolase
MNTHSTFSRRRFAQATAVGASSLAATSLLPKLSSAAEPVDSRGWIDAHVHVWNPDTVKYPIGPRFKKADMQPPSFTAAELFAHSQPVGVDRIVLIQMSFYEHDHTYMTQVMQSHPGVFSGVALIDYRAENLADQVDQLASQGMRGFRLYSPDIVAGVDDPGMAMLWTKAAKDGLAICPLINPADIHHVDALCKRFPETTVVVDHFARVGVSDTIEAGRLNALCGLAKHPKAHVKTSAFYALGKKTPPYKDLIPMIRKVVDAFGPERLMWASDCPYQVQDEHDYESSLALIRDHIDFLSDRDKRWMLSKTAEKVFFAERL